MNPGKNMKPEKKENPKLKSSQRRDFLKYSLIAGGGFLAGKFLDSVTEKFTSKKGNLKSFEASPGSTKIFKNFVVEETGKELSFFDKGGYKIFIIEK